MSATLDFADLPWLRLGSLADTICCFVNTEGRKHYMYWKHCKNISISYVFVANSSVFYFFATFSTFIDSRLELAFALQLLYLCMDNQN